MNRRFKQHLRSTVGSALLLPLAVATPAIAQDADSAEKAAASDSQQQPSSSQGSTGDPVIVVEGTRLANQLSIDAKRNETRIADVIVADDVSRLPDFDVTAALRRMPGIAVAQDGDRESYVTIRGLNAEYNYTALDGAVLASTDQDTRRVLLDILPSTVLKTATVYKVFTPDLEAQAIGGYIDMRTRSAFDQAKPYTNITADFGIYDQTDGPNDVDPSFRIAGALSRTFGANDDLGIVLAAAVRKLDRYTFTPTIAGNRYDFYDADTGAFLSSQDPNDPRTNGWPVPQRNSQFLYHKDRLFYGGLAKLEYQPSDDFYAFVQGFYYDSKEKSRRDSVEWQRRSRSGQPDDFTPFSGTIRRTIESTPALIVEELNDDLLTVQGGFDWNTSDRGNLTVNLAHSVGKFSQPGTLYRFSYRTSGSDEGLGWTYDFDGDYSNFPTWTLLDNTTYFDLENYRNLYHRFFLNKNKEDVTELKVDYSYNVADGDLGFGFKTGFKFQSASRSRDEEFLQMDNLVGTDYNQGMVEDTTVFITPGTHVTPILFIDPNLANAYFDANPDLFRENGANERLSLQDDYKISEDIYSGYLQLEYRSDRFNLVGGLRYEKTELDSTGIQRTVLNGVETFPEVSIPKTYEDWLPRVLATFDISDQLVLKAGYSKSVGRASFGDLRPNRSLTFNDSTTIVSISGGNPELEPRRADNYDISLEYYLDDIEGLFSVALFRKEIDNEIVVDSVDEDGIFEGIDVTFRTSQPVNLRKASINGAEFNLVLNSLGFIDESLDGVGFSANYTYADSTASFPSFYGGDRPLRTLPGQPDHSVNLTGFAKFGRFEARLAYNYQSEYLNVTNGREWYDRIWGGREIVDAQLRYRIAEGTVVLLNAKNLNGSFAEEFNAFGSYFSRRDSGQSFWIGFAKNF